MYFAPHWCWLDLLFVVISGFQLLASCASLPPGVVTTPAGFSESGSTDEAATIPLCSRRMVRTVRRVLEAWIRPESNLKSRTHVFREE